ncbi:MAG: D-aminoacyl-tRNA deacylase [Clostridia bacterium]|nr:D-aminoacyl-tRNA deacylase [Clostridia bacterium]
MRVVLQRVAYAKVNVDGKTVGSIDRGIMALVGMNTGDNIKTFEWMFNKLKNIRIFEDGDGKMNLSIADMNYGLLLVPNFSVYADARKGNRPSFALGAKPDEARESFNAFTEYAKNNYDKVECGIFQADMKVELLNDGPITILLDSDKIF